MSFDTLPSKVDDLPSMQMSKEEYAINAPKVMIGAPLVEKEDSLFDALIVKPLAVTQFENVCVGYFDTTSEKVFGVCSQINNTCPTSFDEKKCMKLEPISSTTTRGEIIQMW